MWETASMCVRYWEAKAIKQLQCFLSSPNFMSTHIRLSAPPPNLEGHLFEYCSICFKKWYYIKTTFGMLMWETASMCVRYWDAKAIKQLQCFLSSPNFISTHIRLSAPPVPLGRALIRIL